MVLNRRSFMGSVVMGLGLSAILPHLELLRREGVQEYLSRLYHDYYRRHGHPPTYMACSKWLQDEFTNSLPFIQRWGYNDEMGKIDAVLFKGLQLRQSPKLYGWDVGLGGQDNDIRT